MRRNKTNLQITYDIGDYSSDMEIISSVKKILKTFKDRHLADKIVSDKSVYVVKLDNGGKIILRDCDC